MRYSQWIEIEEVIGTFIRRDYGPVKAGTTVVDVGASLGSFSLYAAKAGAKVLSYEPAPSSFELLKANIKLNSLQKSISAYKQGVAGKSGKREFVISKFSPLSSFYVEQGDKVSVDCVSLKDIFKKHNLKTIDILKLDCEGAEYEILYQTPKSILDKISEIRLEYHVLPQKLANAKSLGAYLKRNGFKLIRERRDAKISGILWFSRLQS